jgi:Helix-loop-helix DNA-binding domain
MTNLPCDSEELFLVVVTGIQDDYEYMRKFSSNDDSINQSSPTSSFQYPVYSQLDKNGKDAAVGDGYRKFQSSLLRRPSDYIMEDYYGSSRAIVGSSTINYNNNVITNKTSLNLKVTASEEIRVPVVRVVKRRNTANKKERRRTQSINSAYSSLREHIPNVPSDTKLSKVGPQSQFRLI